MNKYAKLPPVELESHLNDFPFRSWSISKVSQFTRNEKEFERVYLYQNYNESLESASRMAGTMYDECCNHIAIAIMQGNPIPTIEELTLVGIAKMEEVPPNKWKVPPTKTLEKVIAETSRRFTIALDSLFAEMSSIFGDVKEIITLQGYYDQEAHEYRSLRAWIQLFGRDIPLPYSFRPDMVYINHEDELVIIDNKCVYQYTQENKINWKYGNQAIGYTLGIEALVRQGEFDEWVKKYPKMKEGVKHFYFLENKNSKNSDGSNQIRRIEIDITPENRRYYEWRLYEPTMKMLNAITDPNYIYVINESDMWADINQLENFWIETQVESIDAIVQEPSDVERGSYTSKPIAGIPVSTIKQFKEKNSYFLTHNSMDNLTPQERLKARLAMLKVNAEVAHTIESHSVNTYLMTVPPNQPIRAIYTKDMDIAHALGVDKVRISKELVMYEKKPYLAIEVGQEPANALVMPEGELDNKIYLGIDTLNEPVTWNASSPTTPHMLVCGSTGSGKTNFIRGVLKEYRRVFPDAEVIIFDPKYEFEAEPNVFVANEIDEIEHQMRVLVAEMNERMRNKKVKYRRKLIIFDEFADAIDSSTPKGELEEGQKTLAELNKMLLQKSRSAGFNFIEATQRASAKIVGGDVKVNLPVQVCFRVPKAVDSQVVIDEEGAEKLIGNGDGLLRSPNHDSPIRFQSFYTS